MFGKFEEQMKKSSQPAKSLLAANAKLLEKVSEQQTELLSGVITDSLKLMDTCAEQSELKGVLAAQSMFAQSLRDRMTSASKTTYSTLNDAGQQYTAVVKQSFETASEVSKEVAQQAAEAAKKPVSVATEKEVAPVTKKAVPKKVPVKKVAAKPAAKKVVAKPTAKKAEPVAKLSADEVKASPATKTAAAKKPAAAKKTPASKKTATK